MIEQATLAVACGFLGGLIHLLLTLYENEKIVEREVLAHLMLSPIVGFILYLNGITDWLTLIFGGFFAIDVVRMLSRGLKPTGRTER